MTAGAGQRLQFNATELVVEFQVGVKKAADTKAGIKFWVIELGGGGSRASESIQKVTLTLEPLLDDGGRVRIAAATDDYPLGSDDDCLDSGG